MAKFRKTTAATVVKDLRAAAAWLAKHGHAMDKRDMAKHLNNGLDTLFGADSFGTEGQNDPRGDHRG